MIEFCLSMDNDIGKPLNVKSTSSSITYNGSKDDDFVDFSIVFINRFRAVNTDFISIKTIAQLLIKITTCRPLRFLFYCLFLLLIVSHISS